MIRSLAEFLGFRLEVFEAHFASFDGGSVLWILATGRTFPTSPEKPSTHGKSISCLLDGIP
jgi:hypothetical protein